MSQERYTSASSWSRPVQTHAAVVRPRLQDWLRRLPEQNEVLFYIVTPGKNQVQAVTAPEFAERIGKWAGRLATLQQSVVPVFGRMTADMLAAWFGAAVAGKKPAFISYPSHKLSAETYREKLANYKRHFQATHIVGEPIDRDTCSGVITSEDLSGPVVTGLDRHFRANEVLFLQCSSGSTGLQKAVGIQTGQLESQLAGYLRTLDMGRHDDCIVSWLPLYHDMGLIACFLLPLLAEIPVVYLDPFEWVANPDSLLQTIEAARGTLCWMPNFAFSLLGRKRTRADLGTMRAFINCSEPVFHADMAGFVMCHGLRENQVATCYALAENVFAATQSEPGQPVRTLRVQAGALARNRVIPSDNRQTGQLLTSCGRPVPGVEIGIDAGSGQEVGEILLRGPCTVSSYYGQAPVTREGWFPTGDLGFLHEGELYICGRKKDLIIQRGKNLYPHDLEAVANLHPGVKPGRTVALGWHDPETGSEHVQLLVESPDRLRFHDRLALSKSLEAELDAGFGIQSRAAVVPQRWLDKTSSGKIARRANLQRFRKASGRRILVLGDSHVRVFWTGFNTHKNAYRAIQAHWAGVLWADNWRESWPLALKLCAGMSADDVLVIQTGEPECRTVFAASGDPPERIRQSVSGYRDYFRKLGTICPGELAYLSGIPTRVNEVQYPHPDWRCRGTVEDRYRWQQEFYSAMRALCDETGIACIDACSPFLSSNGRIASGVLRDGVHLDPKYRTVYLDLFYERFGYIDQSLAPLQNTGRDWNGSYEHYLVLARALVRQIVKHPDQVDENHLVTSGALDSMGLVEFICGIEQFFGFDVQLNQVGRMDFESLRGIWERFHG